jgi:mono/diheme cytochrome c family protein
VSRVTRVGEAHRGLLPDVKAGELVAFIRSGDAVLHVIRLSQWGEKRNDRFAPNYLNLNLIHASPKRGEVTDQVVDRVLKAAFGTPDDPQVTKESGLDLARLQAAAGPIGGNHRLGTKGLYREHCGYCHGISGDGNGPASRYLDPYPRDFRQGWFKFKSTFPEHVPPTRDDLRKSIRRGISGTAMPPFERVLDDTQVDAVIEYVRYLTLRSRTELQIRREIDGNTDVAAMERMARSELASIPTESSWRDAEKNVFAVPARDERRIKTQNVTALLERFYCNKCHSDQAPKQYDNWNLWKLNSRRMDLEVHQLPVQHISPERLRLDRAFGAWEPDEIYRVIANGILPAPMPGQGARSPEDKGNLQPEEIWALVDYVLERRKLAAKASK